MTDLAYYQYWRRKKLLSGPVPRFPVRRWWPTEDLCDIEQALFEAVRHAPALLDVGAGDLRIQRKFKRAGYQGEHHTVDLGSEYQYTYRNLDEVRRTYGAILCLDLIEHLPLADGLAMIQRLVELLDPGGVLVLQTPNARCVRHPLSWDMTHLHVYNSADLWAYLTCAELAVTGYRVVFGPQRRGPIAWLRFWSGAYVASRLLGCDYADNLVLVARKQIHQP